MMIRELALTYFRCYDNALLTFGPSTVLVGPNGSGKSTIQDALTYLATGACRGTTHDGKGIENVIRQGEAEMLVQAETDVLGVVSRGIASRVITRGAHKGETEQAPFVDRADELLEVVGVSRRVWELAVRPDAFLRLHGREQAEALLELAGVEPLTLEALLGAECPQTIREYAGQLDGTLEGYCTAQAAAFRDRTEANRKMKTARAALDASVPTAYDRRAHDEAQREYDAAHTAWESARDADRKARAERDARVVEVKRRIRRLEEQSARAAEAVDAGVLGEQRARLAAELDVLRASADGRSAAELAEAIRRTLILDDVTVASLEERLEQATADAGDANDRADAIHDALDAMGEPDAEPARPDVAEDARRIQALLDAAEDGDPRCYACDQPVDVETLRAQLAAIADELEAYETSHATWAADQAERKRHTDELAEIAEAGHAHFIAELDAALERARERDAILPLLENARAVERTEREVATLDAEIARAQATATEQAAALDVQAELGELRAELDELNAWISPHIAAVETTRAAMVELERVVAMHMEAQRDSQHTARLRAEWDEASDYHESLDGLVQALQGPVRQVLLGGPLQRLQADLSDALMATGTVLDGDGAPVRVYDAEITLDERGRLDVLLVKQPGEDELRLPMECCSESERLRLAWALQCVAGLRTHLVVLDSPEALDDRFRYAPYDIGAWLTDCDVQVIVCTLRLPADEAPEGWDVVRIDQAVEVAGGVLA